ncbi:glycosyltransferase [Bacillus weihaiensis]|uniref:glycosyltransferase n=1 Tax=Bacillus weihaiensis TaxID=1547283 RepID=UPI002356BE06|nr:glycosyltransferase [Bacillus weihaiensis]
MDIASINSRLSSLKNQKSKLLLEITKEKELIKKLSPEEDFNKYFKNLKLTDFKEESINVEEYLKERSEVSDQDFFQSIKSLVEQIPESNGSRFYEKNTARIGIVADEFLFESYKGIANFTYITPENYKEYQGEIDVFLFATAWRGLNNEWRGVGNPNSVKKRQALYEIIDFFRKDSVKIVFYSKEDPVNYDRFIDIAKKCDYVFTTAVEMLPSYKQDCNHENVFVLEFGVNPMYHNPIGTRMFAKLNEVLFAGSWYQKYEDRQDETRMIFEGVLNSGRDLKIIDRNYELNNPSYFFPTRYLPYISPAITHGYLQKLHKLYDWSINLNSVKFSDTMFANRVYELQAIGNILLSNYSVGINNKFPNVFLINNSEEVSDIINGFNEKEVYQHQMYGVRSVMSNETTFQRLEYLLERIGFSHNKTNRSIAVVVKELTSTVEENFKRQTYENKHLILEEDLMKEDNVNFDMISFFHPDRFYGEYYLEDMVNAFKYTDSDYVTKDSYYIDQDLQDGTQHNYVRRVRDKHRTVFWAESFNLEDLLELDGEKDYENGYSVDPLEYNENINTHILFNDEREYSLSVIIPVYNNGKHLLNKCFNSLRRSSIFDEMEILLVDDGSSDPNTLMLINRIERSYPNVKSYFYQDNGSGSASRPRNKGYELSTAQYITYLDPDNEAVQDGYAELLKTIKADNYDMVIGNIVKLDDKKSIKFDYYKTVLKHSKADVILEPKKFLVDANLRAQSIQALLVKREIIGDNHLEMVLNAGGQDTLFFHELVLNSNRIKVINLNIHIYYAAVTGSVTNTITKRFFQKFLVLEKHRIPFLQKHNLMDIYMESRFSYYFINWYLKRLPLVRKEDTVESIDILFEIYSMYKGYIKHTDPTLRMFEKLCKNKRYSKIMDTFLDTL